MYAFTARIPNFTVIGAGVGQTTLSAPEVSPGDYSAGVFYDCTLAGEGLRVSGVSFEAWDTGSLASNGLMNVTNCEFTDLLNAIIYFSDTGGSVSKCDAPAPGNGGRWVRARPGNPSYQLPL